MRSICAPALLLLTLGWTLSFANGQGSSAALYNLTARFEGPTLASILGVSDDSAITRTVVTAWQDKLAQQASTFLTVPLNQVVIRSFAIEQQAVGVRRRSRALSSLDLALAAVSGSTRSGSSSRRQLQQSGDGAMVALLATFDVLDTQPDSQATLDFTRSGLAELAAALGAASVTVNGVDRSAGVIASFFAPPPPSPRPGASALRGQPPLAPKLFAYFDSMLAPGAPGRSREVVWYDDSDLLKERLDGTPLNLVWRNKSACFTRPTCGACSRAWGATAAPYSVTLYFRDPVQLATIAIRQVNAPAVKMVQLLPWPAVNITGAPAPRSGFLGTPLFNEATDITPCPGTLTITLPRKRSGLAEVVPVAGSQAELPRALQRTAVGGVVITLSAPPTAASQRTVVEWVRFTGRALYPLDSSEYSM
ncbi:hypothetical protein HYH02_001232 [Chlamydomonas schloesseri]|uniref:Uncharacterized protein n=1 Tax=Chlamydomonas schloesseri TaxID=2026947 RepID=A0A835WUG4_9CHLO|nr:hypothetical protein HYH02_001232 [Chlamydomonas schloesseri]|eukprot:KAG2454197.1 hypothetical protein HYH02_001232 [Chlamydomonas schloesseri]